VLATGGLPPAVLAEQADCRFLVEQLGHAATVGPDRAGEIDPD